MDTWKSIIDLILKPFQWAIDKMTFEIYGVSIMSILIALIIMGIVIRALTNYVSTLRNDTVRVEIHNDKEKGGGKK